MTKSLIKIINLPTINFFLIVFLLGFQWGINDTYIAIYLDEAMGASSQLIGKDNLI